MTAFDPTIRRPRPTPPATPRPVTPAARQGYVPPRLGAWTAVKQIADKVIGDPIKDGLPRTKNWPVGLLPVGVVAMLGIVVAAVMIMASPWIRRADTPLLVNGQLVGTWSVTVLLWLAVLTLALGLTANLHVHVVVRFLVLPLLLTPLMSTLSTALAIDSRGAWVGIGAVVGIVVFTLIRIGRHFAWFEFPVVLLLSATALFVPMGAAVTADFDFRATLLYGLLGTFTSLAVPSLIVTGYSAAQVAVSLSEWTADRLNKLLERPATIALALMLGGLVIFRAVQASLAGDPSWSPAVWTTSIVVLVAALGLSLLLLRLRRDQGLHPVPPEALGNAWTPLAYPLAFLVAPQIGISVLAIHIDSYMTLFGRGDLDWLVEASQSIITSSVMRVLSVGGALWLAVIRARRNDRISPVVLACYVVVLSASTIRNISGARFKIVWTIDALAAALVVLVLVMAAVLWLREGHREVIWKQVLLVTGLATLFQFREPLSEPSLVFAGISATMVMLLSLTWRILTDGTLTRGDSPRLPRSSRVMFFGTAVLLSAVTLAWSAQTRITGYNDHQTVAELGDHMLGKPLMMGAAICAIVALLGRLTDDEPGENRF